MAKDYTIKKFKQEFPNEGACLDKVFKIKFGDNACPKCNVHNSYYRVKTRKCYQCCNCLHQIYPMAGTIFEKSTTKLQYWFYAMWLFSASKNGMSACELQRQIGVTYKTAWRMLKQIRLLMESKDVLTGVIECDETFVGGKNVNRHKDKKVKNCQGRSFKDKTPVFGMLQRGGKVSCHVIPNTNTENIMPHIFNTVEHGATVYTDEWYAYQSVSTKYNHGFIHHNKKQYKEGDICTNGIENFWSIVKRTIRGSYVNVSPKYLQHYVNEVAFRFNHRQSKQVFHAMLEKI